MHMDQSLYVCVLVDAGVHLYVSVYVSVCMHVHLYVCEYLSIFLCV